MNVNRTRHRLSSSRQAHRHIDKALDDDRTRDRLLKLGCEIPDKTDRGQQPLAELVKSEIARWAPIIKAAGAKAH